VDSSDSAALCKRRGACRVRALPQDGCSCYEREPGADDEPEWSPLRDALPPLKGAPGGGPLVAWAP